MLVLTRKKGQAIKIGDDIVVTVTEVRGRGAKALVKIGIEAPKGTKVLREEVMKEIADEMALASGGEFDLRELEAEVKTAQEPKTEPQS
ncbi:MAG: carbon storage regulator [Bacillota bacterium]|jgi:carbon storage regulator|nr:carbon storage regulator [Candidatus Fermentithermobacillaceae bacterium]